MNIYSSSQIRSWDSFTIHHEPITSLDLMERAATQLFQWIKRKFPEGAQFIAICGPGNNGGDGLALSRLLIDEAYQVRVFLSNTGTLSTDCRTNLERLESMQVRVDRFTEVEQLPVFPAEAIVIDALFGSGLSRPVEGPLADLIIYLNKLPNKIISIDLPSGLPPDSLAANEAVVEADYTLTFQVPRFSFFLPEHEAYTGKWEILDIGLHPAFEASQRTSNIYVDSGLVKYFLPPARSVHAHKGQFGHAMLLAGSPGMTGAAIMGAKACIRSGAGLVTLGVSDWSMPILQTQVPEAMCAPQALWMQHNLYQSKTAIGVGMGWLQDEFHAHLLQWLISNVTAPLLLDATALNILAIHPEWLEIRPKGTVTVITPHPGEFARLAGKPSNSVDQLEKAKRLSSEYQVFVVLKGAYTQIITPGGLVYFNSTGNPGMARGGSGDVLAGLLTGLLAQGMAPAVACLLGVYLHGYAGDMAARAHSQQGMSAMDLIHFLPAAWSNLLKQ